MGEPMQYDLILKYKVDAVLKQPLHVGSAMGDKSEVLVHPVDGRPFVQATSITGAFRNYFREQFPKEEDYLFGSSRKEEGENSGSRIRITDGRISEASGSIRMEYRPRVKINGYYGTVSSDQKKGTSRDVGHKFEMLLVGAGERLQFSIYLYLKKQDQDRIEDEMRRVFGAMDQNEILLGGQKSNGCGYLGIEKLLFRTFDMSVEADRSLWVQEDELKVDGYQEITSEIIRQKSRDYLVTVRGKTEGELQVKGIALSEFGEDAADTQNIQNANKDYIIPGSALKGVIRNRMTMIAEYLFEQEPKKAESLIARTFGKTREQKGNDGAVGCIFFADTIIGDREAIDRIPIRNRIHIDKFTGGVTHGGKFSEKNAAGDFEMVIRIKDGEDASLGLLVLALRDLAVGAYSVGGGSNIGKGFLDIAGIRIAQGDSVAELCMKDGKQTDASGLVERSLGALNLLLERKGA